MLKFSQYITEQTTLGTGSLTIFDVDETLFKTTAKILVMKGGKVEKELTNSEFNNYELKQGEEFNFSQFRDAAKFHAEAEPIQRMLNKAKIILKNSEKNPLSKVIIVTARANFDNKNLFLDKFRKHGLNIDNMRVERAGNIMDVHDVAFKKVIIIRNYLHTKQFKKVRLFDDSMTNLRAFLKLRSEFPTIKFEAFFAQHDGSVKVIK